MFFINFDFHLYRRNGKGIKDKIFVTKKKLDTKEYSLQKFHEYKKHSKSNTIFVLW